MSTKTAASRSVRQVGATSMTVTSRRLGALGSLASAVGLAAVAACSSSAGSEPQSWTAKPNSAQVDGGTSDSRNTIIPPDYAPGPLCDLTGAPKPAPGEVLVYSDEFETAEIDPQKWEARSGYLGHDTIANTATPANAVVSNGLLQIVTSQNPSDVEHPYLSARLESLNRFARTYGKIEFRARFPYAAGVWYAIWGRPWSQSFPEIDIEIVNRPGKPASELYFVNHWAAPPLPADERRSFVMNNAIDVHDWHTYTMTWTPGAFDWARDGVKMFDAEPRGVPDLPVYWIINGWVGGWTGAPDSTTPFPNAFEVDYMRVYRLDGLIADPLIRVGNPKETYAKNDVIQVAIANFDEVCAQVAMYDGETLLRTMSKRPLLLPLAGLSTGAHTFKFVATDGDRTVTTTIQATIN